MDGCGLQLAGPSMGILLFPIYSYTKLLTKDGEKKADDYQIAQNDFKNIKDKRIFSIKACQLLYSIHCEG